MFINTYLCFPGPVVLWVLKLRFHILFLDSFEIAPTVFIRQHSQQKEKLKEILICSSQVHSTQHYLPCDLSAMEKRGKEQNPCLLIMLQC